MASEDVSILIIDDEAVVRDNLAAYLEDEGFVVAVAASGEEGLKALSQGSFDLAVVDMRLPDMSGNDFIRSASKYPAAPAFIIHTGSLEYSLPEDLRELGLQNDQILLKPVVDMALLSAKVRQLVH